MARDEQFYTKVLKIHRSLDRLDYYKLLGLDLRAGAADVKQAFYAVARRYHPDRHREVTTAEQQALYAIYKRLNEAYRVLSNADHRKKYDRGLVKGTKRLDMVDRRAAHQKNPEDTLPSSTAREFYVQAREAMKQGKWMQAELHVQVAKRHAPNAPALDELLSEIRAAKSK